MSLRDRYWLRFDVEVRARDLGEGIERALRLFRPRVRAEMRQGVSYCGSYRGSWFMLQRLKSPPEGRVNLMPRKRKLTKRRRRAVKTPRRKR